MHRPSPASQWMLPTNRFHPASWTLPHRDVTELSVCLSVCGAGYITWVPGIGAKGLDGLRTGWLYITGWGAIIWTPPIWWPIWGGSWTQSPRQPWKQEMRERSSLKSALSCFCWYLKCKQTPGYSSNLNTSLIFFCYGLRERSLTICQTYSKHRIVLLFSLNNSCLT